MTALSPEILIFVSLLIGIVAFCYASVGHGGASGYLGVLSFFILAPKELSSTALLLNILVSATSSYSYFKAGHLRQDLLRSFLITSVPFAFLGGTLHISVKLYSLILAVALMIAAIRLNWKLQLKSMDAPKKLNSFWIPLLVGALIGVVSGLIGIEGGIFLSPLLLLANWATPKESAAISAPFILVNSCAGLLGRYFSGALVLGQMTPFLICAFLGGLLGSHLGANRFTSSLLRAILAIVLILASFKLSKIALY